MVFWCRIKQSQLKTLSNQFKRCYFQLHGPSSLNYTASHTRSLVLDKPSRVYHLSQFDFFNHVRFFAAPVQVKPKQEEKDNSGPRLNEQITAQFIRLVTDEGHDVVSRNEALQRAKKLNIDLVEVDRKSKPPVCRLMDYHRERYNQRLKEKERLKGKSELVVKKGACKEVRFAFKIEGKDLQMKADTVKRLMERGYRVKCMATGTEQQDLGGLLSRLAALIEEFSIVESGPHVEKKQAYVIVRHVKFGPMKKGTKKLSDIVMPTGPKLENSPQTPVNAIETVSGDEDDVNSEEDEPIEDPATNKQSSWLVRDANDDFDKVFKLGNDPSKGSKPAPGFKKIPSPSPPVSDNRYRREPRIAPPHTNVNGHNARDSLRSVPGFGMFTNTETNNTEQTGPAVVNRYKKVPSVNPPGSNFKGNPPGSNFKGNSGRPDQAR